MEEVPVTIKNPAAQPKAKEILYQPSYDSLGSRILLTVSNFDKFHPILDPNKKDVAAITEQDIQTDRKKYNLKILNEVSDDERRKKNGVASEHLTTAVTEWASDASERFNRIKPLKKQIQNFLGLDEASDFTTEQVITYYKKYFDVVNQGTKYEVFADDIIERYASSGNFDFEAYNRDIDGIRLFSRKFFGEEGDEIIQKYITHWINFKGDPKKYVTEANKEINTVQDIHKPHLEKLFKKAQEIQTTKKDNLELESIPENIKQELKDVPFGEIKAIEKSRNLMITKRSQIRELVEPLLVFAAERFWDLNIRTLSTSANAKDIGHTGYIIIDYNSLSDENKKIAEEHGELIPNYDGFPVIKFSLPITPETSTQSIQKQSDLFADKFKKQKAHWIPSYTLAEISKKYNAYHNEPELTPEFLIEQGLYYDKEGDKFYLSEEHFQKVVDESEVDEVPAGTFKTVSTNSTDQFAKIEQPTSKPTQLETTPLAEKPKIVKINSLKEILGILDKGQPDEIQNISITEAGLLDLLPKAILDSVKSKNPAAKKFNPQITDDIKKTNFAIDQSGNSGKGTVKGKIGAEGKFLLMPINIGIDIEFKNSDDNKDIVPSGISVQPDNFQSLVADNLRKYKIKEELRLYLQKQIKGRRVLKNLDLSINSKDKTLDVTIQ